MTETKTPSADLCLYPLVRFTVSELYGPFPCDVCGAETYTLWVPPEIKKLEQPALRAHLAVRKGTPLCDEHAPNNAARHTAAYDAARATTRVAALAASHAANATDAAAYAAAYAAAEACLLIT